MELAKVKARAINNSTRTVVANLSRLVEGSALLIAAYYNYSTAYHAHLSSFEFKVRVAASVVIGLRGAYELGRWLADKEVK